MMQNTYELPQMGAAALEPAGFWLRVAAYLIDQVILMAGALFAGIGLGIVLVLGGAPQEASPIAGILLGITVSVGYYWGLVAAQGATFGKQLLGMRIVNLDGSPVSTWQALGRFVCLGISFLPLGLGVLMVGFRQDKRALHDLMVSTKVVRVGR